MTSPRPGRGPRFQISPRCRHNVAFILTLLYNRLSTHLLEAYRRLHGARPAARNCSEYCNEHVARMPLLYHAALALTLRTPLWASAVVPRDRESLCVANSTGCSGYDIPSVDQPPGSCQATWTIQVIVRCVGGVQLLRAPVHPWVRLAMQSSAVPVMSNSARDSVRLVLPARLSLTRVPRAVRRS